MTKHVMVDFNRMHPPPHHVKASRRIAAQIDDAEVILAYDDDISAPCVLVERLPDGQAILQIIGPIEEHSFTETLDGDDEIV